MSKKNRIKREPSDPPKECVIIHVPTGRLMAYVEQTRDLYVSESKSNFYVFPSKSKANSAMHHQISIDKEAGKVEPWSNYRIEEI